MAMVRNEPVARIVMLLCFSTALLTIAVHLHISSSTTSMEATPSSKQSQNSTNNETSITDKLAKFLQLDRSSSSNDSARASSPQQSSLNSQQNPISRESRLVVDLSDRRVYVYRMGEVIASYPTGIGKKGWETPTGSFKVFHMQHDPVWRHPITGKVFPPGEDSPLGDRWIGFLSDKDGEIGFHGTPDDSLVGSPVSHGCLRMRNPDVRMLYNQIKIGTPVEVRH
ncbi:L,D-transpeptidase [Calothrix sp. UHCC 0171]|uniref:L,D-transpeptidase n=1 Tax=Calothrix sp. UHCC 0171 TaxID=3110245 RepID=UPI002B1F4E10|nr:L,D-transpeptidase [Calothrix sp. UHCC 0171]MEA5573358.1 L,D-transpeptidase [Calothrix sp. UHCC 0171]